MELDSYSTDPIRHMYRQDLEHAFYSFCSLVCMLKNKKMNIASVFIEILENEGLQKVFMEICDHQTKYDAVRAFLTIEPALQKSKYIKRYINKKLVEN